MEVHVSINTNGSPKELSRSSNSYFAAGLDFVSKEINAVYAQIYDLVNGWEVTK